MRVSTCLIAAATLLGSFAAGSADDNGVATALHQTRQVAGRTCFTDHTHDGTGIGQTQKIAMAEAIAAWRGFTDLEYGSDWASYNNSIEKTASCKTTSTGFECSVNSTPCKGGVLVQHQRPDRRRHAKRHHVAQVKQ